MGKKESQLGKQTNCVLDYIRFGYSFHIPGDVSSAGTRMRRVHIHFMIFIASFWPIAGYPALSHPSDFIDSSFEDPVSSEVSELNGTRSIDPAYGVFGTRYHSSVIFIRLACASSDGDVIHQGKLTSCSGSSCISSRHTNHERKGIVSSTLTDLG